MEQAEEERRDEEPAPLVGFLFGNVDENNKVEADYLDAVSPAAWRDDAGRLAGQCWQA